MAEGGTIRMPKTTEGRDIPTHKAITRIKLESIL